MPALQRNVSLQPYNTFGIKAAAKWYVRITEAAQLPGLITLPVFKENRRLLLGGGSNILLTQDFDGLVIHIAITGIHVESITNDQVWVRAGAGHNWHALVLHCVAQGWGGIENLSLIPGTVGAAPIQNIGAYGAELKDVFHSLQAFDFEVGRFVTLDAAACRFGYRDSIFKHPENKNRYAITDVTLRLHRHPVLNLQYDALQKELQGVDASALTIADVSNAVVRVRQSKLPDPAVIGNAGSFFKNPAVALAQFQALRQQHPNMPAYPQPDGSVKLAAGWLIEQCGFKGRRTGNTGSHAQQALVLVNYGNASGQEVLALANSIRQAVLQRFGVQLEMEVNVV